VKPEPDQYPEKPSDMSPQDNLEVFPLEPFQGASASMTYLP